MTATPTQLQQIDPQTLGITWSDGHESRYGVRDLRLACRCALCVDEMTGQPRLDPRHIAETVHPVQIRPVGHYALRIHWSDGHQSGIYRFDHLRLLCRCPQCQPA